MDRFSIISTARSKTAAAVLTALTPPPAPLGRGCRRPAAADVDRAVARRPIGAFSGPAWAGLTGICPRAANCCTGWPIWCRRRRRGSGRAGNPRHRQDHPRDHRPRLPMSPNTIAITPGLADKIEGAHLPIDKPDMEVWLRREPLGVVAAIVPWNSQLFLSAVKLGPALAAGCTAGAEGLGGWPGADAGICAAGAQGRAFRPGW